MLKLYGPADEPSTLGDLRVMVDDEYQAASDRSVPSTADQILFLIESVSCFRVLRHGGSSGGARPRIL